MLFGEFGCNFPAGNFGGRENSKQCALKNSSGLGISFLGCKRMLGGCTMGYNKISIRLENVWRGEGYLGVDIISADINSPLRLINAYGPCHSREPFWKRLLEFDFMQVGNTMIGGYLNFSLGLAKSWGNRARIDPLMAFFEVFLDSHELLNIETTKLLPTWRN